jgi:hypothetical protein
MDETKVPHECVASSEQGDRDEGETSPYPMQSLA